MREASQAAHHFQRVTLGAMEQKREGRACRREGRV